MEEKKEAVQTGKEEGKTEEEEYNMCRNTNIIAFPDGSVNIAVESTPIDFVSQATKRRTKSSVGIASIVSIISAITKRSNVRLVLP